MVKPNAKLALLPLALCIASAPALAVSNAELEQRLQEQEKKIKKMERRVKSTRNAVKQNRSRLSDMSSRLKINGFFTSGVSQGSSKDLDLNLFNIDEDYSTSSVSKFGVQMTFQVSDDIDVTGQLVAKGVDNYDVIAEWAYISWDVSDNLTARVGRQRTPYYLLSEYLDVGYAYPWTRPPIEMYSLPLNNTDGLALLYDFNMGDWNFGTHAYIGEGFGDVDQLAGSFKLQNRGVAFTAATGPWSMRFGYSNSEVKVVEIDPNGAGAALLSGINDSLLPLAAFVPGADVKALPQDGIETNYLSLAGSYDDGAWLVIAEYSNLEVKDFVQPAGDGGYVMVGYRFGKWMPHVTYSQFSTDSKNDDQVQDYIDAALAVGRAAPTLSAVPAVVAGIATGMAQIANGLETLVQQQDSITLGVVYDITSRVKAKFDVTEYSNFGEYNNYAIDAGGIVTTTELDGYGRFGLSDDADATDIDSSTTIYTFAIDAVF